ncbi:hypothetical protein B0H19DRAFT_376324 [Mycena capillaripes]|nr:hypothetical protein B0H19DRAFT_376324 [Mycena capillaripes]
MPSQKKIEAFEAACTNTTAPSVIQRFPTEILVDIFAECWGLFTPDFDEIDIHGASFETEIARLAHVPLLAVSQVCLRWHTIAIETPSLWCDIQLDGALWDTPSHIEKATDLLQSTLNRSGTSPLNLDLTQVAVHLFPSPVLQVLAAHSQRWRKLVCPFSVIYAFAAIGCALPRLGILDIEDLSPDELGALDLGLLPSLRHLSITGPAPRAKKLPLEQLNMLKSMAFIPEAPDVLSSISRLPKTAEFRLELVMWTGGQEMLHLHFRPTTTNIFSLYIQLVEEFNPPDSEMVLGCVFASLTLPCLRHFELECQEYPRCVISWPHAEFLSLSGRSSLDAHLRSLELYEVDVTEAQLLECLSGLPSLERLAISDHQAMEYGEGLERLLVSDSLLAKLTRTPDTLCLIPRLRSLGCQTVLQFDDKALLALAVSRLDDSEELTNEGRFELELSWLPGRERGINANVLAQFSALGVRTKNRFKFRICEAESEWV